MDRTGGEPGVVGDQYCTLCISGISRERPQCGNDAAGDVILRTFSGGHERRGLYQNVRDADDVCSAVRDPACAGGGAYACRKVGEAAGAAVSCADGCGNLSGVFDAVLLFYFSVLSGGGVWRVDAVAGAEAVELRAVRRQPGSRVCAGLSDLSGLSGADVPGAERSAGHGEFL